MTAGAADGLTFGFALRRHFEAELIAAGQQQDEAGKGKAQRSHDRKQRRKESRFYGSGRSNLNRLPWSA